MHKYFTSTNISANSRCTVLSDIFAGNGTSYRMHSVIVEDSMDTEIHKLSYGKEQRYKLFQPTNISRMTLPFRINNKNIQDASFKNENYGKEL